MSGRRPAPAAVTLAYGHAARSLPGVLDLLLVDTNDYSRRPQQHKHKLSQESTPTAQAAQPSPVGSLFDMDLGTPGDAPAEGRQGASRRSAGVSTPGAPTKVPALNAAAALAAMDRSLSDLDQYKTIKAATGVTEVDQLIQLCCPTTDIELAVAEHLRHVRSLPRAVSMDTEDLAAELLAMGLLVQVRRGVGGSDAAAGRNTRDCLRTLRHTFMVCTGYQRGAAGEPVLFREPLVVEPRFKEQFLIAHPTPAYEELLQVLPISFVGSVRRLEAAVRLLAEQIALAFKHAGRALPPWRSAEAMLSKWAPSQLTELARLLRATGTTQHQAAVKASAVLQVPPVAAPSAFAASAALPMITEQHTATDTSTHHQHQQQQQQGVSQEALQALDMVRSMSRQMSHSGMCARSLPETHAARLQAESLRRSLCGLGAAACQLSPMRTSTGGVPGQQPFAVSSKADDAARDARDTKGTPTTSAAINTSERVVVFGQHRSTNTSSANLVDKLQPAARVSAPGALPQGGVTRQQQQQQVQQQGALTAGGAVGGMVKGHKASPFSVGLPDGPPLELGSLHKAPVHLTALPTLTSSVQLAPPVMQQQQLPVVPEQQQQPKLGSRAVSYVAEGGVMPAAVTAAVAAALGKPSSQAGLTSHVSAPPVTLTITRQSSTEMKRALMQERTSALAAALRASPHPSAAPAHHLPGKDVVMRVSSPAFPGGGVVGQGAAGVVRAVYEEVWPPKITTVKWGAAGHMPP